MAQTILSKAKLERQTSFNSDSKLICWCRGKMISEIIIAAQKRNHGASVEDEPNKLRVIGRSRDYTPGIVAHHNEIRQRRRFVNLVFLEETEIRRGKIWQRKKNMQ